MMIQRYGMVPVYRVPDRKSKRPFGRRRPFGKAKSYEKRRPFGRARPFGRRDLHGS
jgi:hypothetical protein